MINVDYLICYIWLPLQKTVSGLFGIFSVISSNFLRYRIKGVGNERVGGPCDVTCDWDIEKRLLVPPLLFLHYQLTSDESIWE